MSTQCPVDIFSGIGEATARLLVEEGIRVVLVARRWDRIAALAKELGDNALPIAADVADPDWVSPLFEQVRIRYGRLDLLFNDAGLGIRVSVIEPGAVWTEFGENVAEALNARRETLDALTSKDMARALVYALPSRLALSWSRS